MLFSLLNGGTDGIIYFLFSIPVILFSLSFHEASHAYVAHRLGDETANYAGRITLNPLAHLDLFGFLSMVICGIGWAKPVPINARNFKNPRTGMAITGIAGPIANLLLGVAATFLYVLILAISVFVNPESTFSTVLSMVNILFYVATYLNFALMIFNLIPIPPFDGSRFLFLLLPPKWYFKVMRYERYYGLILLLVIFILSEFGIYPVGFLAGKLFDLVEWTFIQLANLILHALAG